MAKVQAFVFYVLRSTFRSVLNDGLEDWKALVVMSIASTLAVFILVAVISISLQRRVLLPDTKLLFVALWGTISTALLILNYYSLVSGHKWSRFERDFQRSSNLVRTWGGVAVWAIVILLLVAGWWTLSNALKLPPPGTY